VLGPGRNQPCRCGSGRKTKHCCGEQRGPSEEQLARAHVAKLAHQTIHKLDGLSDRVLDHLADELMDLPARCWSHCQDWSVLTSSACAKQSNTTIPSGAGTR